MAVFAPVFASGRAISPTLVFQRKTAVPIGVLDISMAACRPQSSASPRENAGKLVEFGWNGLGEPSASRRGRNRARKCSGRVCLEWTPVSPGLAVWCALVVRWLVPKSGPTTRDSSAAANVQNARRVEPYRRRNMVLGLGNRGRRRLRRWATKTKRTPSVLPKGHRRQQQPQFLNGQSVRQRTREPVRTWCKNREASEPRDNRRALFLPQAKIHQKAEGNAQIGGGVTARNS